MRKREEIAFKKQFHWLSHETADPPGYLNRLKIFKNELDVFQQRKNAGGNVKKSKRKKTREAVKAKTVDTVEISRCPVRIMTLVLGSRARDKAYSPLIKEIVPCEKEFTVHLKLTSTEILEAYIKTAKTPANKANHQKDYTIEDQT